MSVPATAPPLSGPVLSDQRWVGAGFLHWAVHPAAVAHLLPAGTRPDLFGGTTYVSLVLFAMHRAGPGRGHPVPWLGDFLETNVRLYSVDAEGRHGVVFRSLEAQRLFTVLGVRYGYRIPYTWSRMTARTEGDLRSWTTVRRWPARGLRSSVRIRVLAPVEPTDLDVFLTARWGAHSRLAGRTVWTPNEHEPWPLHAAELLDLDDDLVHAAGVAVTGRPTVPVRWSLGVHARFGFPVAVHGT